MTPAMSTGLALTPSDCAEQLAEVADHMRRVASGMAWVAEYGEHVEPEMRERLKQHAEEMSGAGRMTKQLANALAAAA